MTHPVEQELIKATKFKGVKFTRRQDYLAALLAAIDSKLNDDAYDNLSDEAAEWHKTAVAAFESKDDIPDFEEPLEDEPEDDPEEAEDDSSEDEETAEDDEVDDEATDKEEPLNSTEAEEPEDDEAGDTEPTDEADGPAGEADDGVGDGEEEAQAPARKKAAKAKAKPVKEQDKKVTTKVAKKVIDYTKLTGARNEYGIIIGTKTHEAIKLYEKGATLKQVENAIGGRHYNILTKLAGEGHKVEKLEGGVWKLTHKGSPKGNTKKKGK
jgi:hypothetical protein